MVFQEGSVGNNSNNNNNNNNSLHTWELPISILKCTKNIKLFTAPRWMTTVNQGVKKLPWKLNKTFFFIYP